MYWQKMIGEARSERLLESLPASRDESANRVMYYDVRRVTDDFLLQRVEYEYATNGDAAGNVTQVMREYPVDQSESPFVWNVYGTHMTYKKDGELRIVTQRHWNKIGFGPGEGHQAQNAAVLKIREFRGQGRARHMTRLRSNQAPNAVLADTDVWTDYEGDLPWSDYKVTDCDPATTTEKVRHYELGTAELDYGPPSGGNQPIEAVDYVHADHLGTTRGRTNDPLPPGLGGAAATITARPVYTAFGERVHDNGLIGCGTPASAQYCTSPSRYGYVGEEGYETFEDASDPYYWGVWDPDGPGGNPAFAAPFGYLHVGHRWYDPETGRFLQRDPIGIRGGVNTYGYVEDNPTSGSDPTGFGKGRLDRASGDRAYISSCHLQWAMGNECCAELPDYPFPLPNYPPPPPKPRRPKKKRSPVWHSPVHGGTGIGCFVEGTLIATEHGFSEIEGLQSEDCVRGWNIADSSEDLAGVIRKSPRWATDIVSVSVEGDTIRCTPNHPFWVVTRGWVTAGRLTRNDLLLDSLGQYVPILDVKRDKLGQLERVYDLSVTNSHTFFVGKRQVLVHNKTL